MKQRQSKTKIPTIAGTLPNNGALLNQHYKSQEEFEAAARANTAALFANLKPNGWTASLKTTFHKSATFMDYLHGEVKDEEAQIACRYEFARESKDVWDAAKLRDDVQKKRNLTCEQAFWRVHHEFEHWIQATGWLTDFFLCESFPYKDWNALSDAERKQILFLHETRKVPPLKMQILHYLHYPKAEFPEFNELAAQTEPVVKDVRPGEPQERLTITEAMVQKSGSIYYCLFLVDFSESPKAQFQRFVEWLKLPKIAGLRMTQGRRIPKNGKSFRAMKTVQWHASIHWCLFEVDLSANKTELAMQFKKWLALRENKRRIKEHNNEKRGTSANHPWKVGMVGRKIYAPLGLTLVGPVVVNILAFHAFMAPSGLPVALVVSALALFLLWSYRGNFSGLLKPAYGTSPKTATGPRVEAVKQNG